MFAGSRYCVRGLERGMLVTLNQLGVKVVERHVVTKSPGRMDVWCDLNGVSPAVVHEKLSGHVRQCGFECEKETVRTEKKSPVVVLQVGFECEDAAGKFGKTDKVKVVELFNRRCRTNVAMEKTCFTTGKKSRDVVTCVLEVESVDKARSIANETSPAFDGDAHFLMDGTPVTLHTYQTSPKVRVYPRGQAKKEKKSTKGSTALTKAACDEASLETTPKVDACSTNQTKPDANECRHSISDATSEVSSIGPVSSTCDSASPAPYRWDPYLPHCNRVTFEGC